MKLNRLVKTSISLAYTYSGAKFLIDKFRLSDASEPRRKVAPSGPIWLMGLHFAIFGILITIHENTLDNWNQYVSQRGQIIPVNPREISALVTITNEFGDGFTTINLWSETAYFLEGLPKIYPDPSFLDPTLIWKFVTSEKIRYLDRNRQEISTIRNLLIGVGVRNELQHCSEYRVLDLVLYISPDFQEKEISDLEFRCLIDIISVAASDYNRVNNGIT